MSRHAIIDGRDIPVISASINTPTRPVRSFVTVETPFRCTKGCLHEWADPWGTGKKIITNSKPEEHWDEDGESYTVLVCAECGAELHPDSREETFYIKGDTTTKNWLKWYATFFIQNSNSSATNQF